MIFLVGVLVELFGLAPEHEGTTTLWYRELLRTLDPGTVANDEGTWSFLFLSCWSPSAGSSCSAP